MRSGQTQRTLIDDVSSVTMSAKGGAPMRASTAMPARDGDLLSAALKAIRRHRGKTATETASAMNMALRTYERFEAGETRLSGEAVVAI